MTWNVSIKGYYLGKVEATLAELREAIGPWFTVEGNHINVFAPSQA